MNSEGREDSLDVQGHIDNEADLDWNKLIRLVIKIGDEYDEATRNKYDEAVDKALIDIINHNEVRNLLCEELIKRRRDFKDKKLIDKLNKFALISIKRILKFEDLQINNEEDFLKLVKDFYGTLDDNAINKFIIDLCKKDKDEGNILIISTFIKHFIELVVKNGLEFNEKIDTVFFQIKNFCEARNFLCRELIKKREQGQDEQLNRFAKYSIWKLVQFADLKIDNEYDFRNLVKDFSGITDDNILNEFIATIVGDYEDKKYENNILAISLFVKNYDIAAILLDYFKYLPEDHLHSEGLNDFLDYIKRRIINNESRLETDLNPKSTYDDNSKAELDYKKVRILEFAFNELNKGNKEDATKRINAIIDFLQVVPQSDPSPIKNSVQEIRSTLSQGSEVRAING